MAGSVMAKADEIMKQCGMLSEEGKPQPQASAPELNDISDAQRQALIENAAIPNKKQVVNEDEEFLRLKAANPKNAGESGMDYVVRLNKLRANPGQLPPGDNKPAPNLQNLNRDELDRDPKLKKKVDTMTAKVKPASTADARAAQRPEDLKTEDTACGSLGMSFAGKASKEDEEMNAGRETTYAKPSKKAKNKKGKKLNRESFDRFVTSVFENIK